MDGTTPELSQDHAIWLEDQRSIPRGIALEHGVVSSGRNLAFEFRRNGVLQYRKVRIEKPDGKSFMRDRQNAPSCLWNEDCLNEPCGPEVPLIITEGEFDALSWITAGATHVVSVPDGAQLAKRGDGQVVVEEDSAFKYLWDGPRLKRPLEAFTKIVLSVDADEKGAILRDELAVRLGRAKCWFVKYPDGCKDANDVLVKFGADALMNMLDDAKPIVPSRLVNFSDIPRRANRRQYGSGWTILDAHLRLQFPELMVVTGSPNSGKSTWALNYVANLARLHDIKTAILQFEDDVDRNREDLERYAQAWSKQGNGDRGIQVDPHDWIDRMFRTIAPAEESDAYDMAWLKSSIQEAAIRHDCRVVLIDPFNEIEHLWKVNETEAQYTNNCLRDLKKLARQLQIAIIIVAHPTKSGGSPKPVAEWSLYDVAGSAAWNNKADHGVVIWRESPKHIETYVKVAKSKNFRTMGTPGTVLMEYNKDTSSFACLRSA
jgi:twinkle protein